MSSRKKPAGCKTLATVTRAWKRFGGSVRSFYAAAMLDAPERPHQSMGRSCKEEITTAVWNLSQAMRRGMHAVRGYEIPAHVINYAEKLTRSTPRLARKHREGSIRPSFAMGGR